MPPRSNRVRPLARGLRPAAPCRLFCRPGASRLTRLPAPTNALPAVFNPVYGTFLTGGGDGVVSVWDGEAKKRLYQFARYPTSIAAVAFNAAGTLMAVASSYTFEEGEKQARPAPPLATTGTGRAHSSRFLCPGRQGVVQR